MTTSLPDLPSAGEICLWIDPSFGASGDMLLGALCGLLGSSEELTSGLSKLDLDGYSIEYETVVRCGISAHRVKVNTKPDGDTSSAATPSRRWSDIDSMLASSDLPPLVEQGSRATFRRLGLAEAAQHDIDLDQVHFHEVGAVDAIVDIVGAWLLLDQILSRYSTATLGTAQLDTAQVGRPSIIVGPVGIGHGTVQASHGMLPLPAPATAALLTGMPIRQLDTANETCTPTGAALLAEFASASGPIPSGTLLKMARGAGGRNPSSHPNVLTAYLLYTTTEATQSDIAQPDLTQPETVSPSVASSATSNQAGILLATNIDDATPEVLANTISLLLEAGADDAWLVPITMKKGRSANELKVLCSPQMAAGLRLIMFRETGTLGIREHSLTKHVLPRELTTVRIHQQNVAVKIGPHGAKPEHDDLVKVSNQTGIPIRTLALEAQAAYFRLISDSDNTSN